MLDPWQGETYVSLVAFLFRDTTVRGLRVPGHRTFEEVNLRFYVRCDTSSVEPRRAVVFIKELVPRPAIAAIARHLYNEPYSAVPMSHATRVDKDGGRLILYSWSYGGQPYDVEARVIGDPVNPEPESSAEFITEHYWGYTRQRDGGTLEYRVEHPRWPVWFPVGHRIEGPFGQLYGSAFGEILSGPPASVLAAPGSAVKVFPGARLR